MILSNIEIQKALDSGRLVITPEPHPRQPEPGINTCPYDTHSVDLRLYNEITIPESGTFTVDLTRTGSLAKFITQNSRKCVLTEDQTFKLEPQQFILGRTVERIKLPIDNSKLPNLAATIEGKSSRARCGLLVHFTAPTVHPGFEGTLTLEMINLSPWAFLLSPNMYIAQLIIEEVNGEIIPNPSQFQNQVTSEGLTS